MIEIMGLLLTFLLGKAIGKRLDGDTGWGTAQLAAAFYILFTLLQK